MKKVVPALLSESQPNVQKRNASDLVLRPREEKVLDFVRRYYVDYGVYPLNLEISLALDLPSSTTKRIKKKLVSKNYLKPFGHGREKKPVDQVQREQIAHEFKSFMENFDLLKPLYFKCPHRRTPGEFLRNEGNFSKLFINSQRYNYYTKTWNLERNEYYQKCTDSSKQEEASVDSLIDRVIKKILNLVRK
jgi:hypothetical protein